MINHDLRCIFVHIPRTGGSSVEHWLCGKNWWLIDPATKHLTARQSRALYAPWWDEYFKFSIVRHPVARVGSMLRFASFFGLSLPPEGGIDFTEYHNRFGTPVTVEFDHRFHKAEDVRHSGHRPGRIYGNTLDCPVDFVARFESLGPDMDRVRAQLGLTTTLSKHLEKSQAPKPEEALAAARPAIRAIYAEDFATYGYDPDA